MACPQRFSFVRHIIPPRPDSGVEGLFIVKGDGCTMTIHLLQTSSPPLPTQVMTRHGYRIVLLSQTDLPDPVRQGDWIRAYCPVHGSDHQRSLSINPTNGFGICFCCQTTVLVKEFNPAATATLLQRADKGHAFARPSFWRSLSSHETRLLI